MLYYHNIISQIVQKVNTIFFSDNHLADLNKWKQNGSEECSPGDSVDPSAITGDTDLIPDPGRSHVLKSKLSPCTTTLEPELQSPGAITLLCVLWYSRLATRDATAMEAVQRWRGSPHPGKSLRSSEDRAQPMIRKK